MVSSYEETADLSFSAQDQGRGHDGRWCHHAVLRALLRRYGQRLC